MLCGAKGPGARRAFIFGETEEPRDCGVGDLLLRRETGRSRIAATRGPEPLEFAVPEERAEGECSGIGWGRNWLLGLKTTAKTRVFIFDFVLLARARAAVLENSALVLLRFCNHKRPFCDLHRPFCVDRDITMRHGDEATLSFCFRLIVLSLFWMSFCFRPLF